LHTNLKERYNKILDSIEIADGFDCCGSITLFSIDSALRELGPVKTNTKTLRLCLGASMFCIPEKNEKLRNAMSQGLDDLFRSFLEESVSHDAL
jgi:hypothetical protein